MPPLERRKRMRRVDNGTFRFVTFSCYHRLPLLGSPALRDAFAEALGRAQRKHGFELTAWVAMPEHVHLLLWPGPGRTPLAPVLAGFKSGFAQAVIGRWRDLDAPILRRIHDRAGRPRYWQRGGGYDRNVYEGGELEEKIRYIHRNPVTRGLVERETDWRWSSARWYYLGERDGPVDVHMR